MQHYKVSLLYSLSDLLLIQWHSQRSFLLPCVVYKFTDSNPNDKLIMYSRSEQYQGGAISGQR